MRKDKLPQFNTFCESNPFDFTTEQLSKIEEDIINPGACVEAKKDFVISLCGTAHRLMNGEMPDDVYQWYAYLESIGDEHCTLIKPSIIPGYICSVMIGFYR